MSTPFRFARLALLCAGTAAAALTAAAATVPFVISITPTTLNAGDPSATLTVNGINFIAGAVVRWNGQLLPVNFVSTNQLSATVSGSLLAIPGTATLLIVNPDGGVSSPFTITVQAKPLSLGSPSLPPAVLGTAYSTMATITGGTPPYTWTAVAALPPGLTLGADGVISGTPSALGTFNFAVRVGDRSGQTVSGTLSLTVNAPPLKISTAPALPAGVLGQRYTAALVAAGGTAPYRWSANGTLPDGLALEAGAVAGTPSARGNFSFSIQVTDANGTVASQTFSLTVNPAPLAVVTEAPLFPATVGSFYSQVLSATGGVAPYTWSTASGQLPAGITLDSKTGALSGTPSSVVTAQVTFQVTDSLGVSASRSYSVTVELPRLSITTPATLAGGTVGNALSQPLAATGGKPPYRWSTVSGGVPGLALNESGLLANTPSEPGTFTVTIQVTDAAGATATRAFTITIAPLALSITTAGTLPNGAIGIAYSINLSARGGVPPYQWSANGLPDGLTLDPGSGSIFGTPVEAGSLSFTVRVTDSARTTVTTLMRLAITLPAVPEVSISGLPSAVESASQYPVRLELGGAFPVDVTGSLLLSFAPDGGIGDPSIQFSTGGRAVSFTIPAGSTGALLPAGLAIQSGTVAGTISIGAQLSAAGLDVTPSPAPVAAGRVSGKAPVITAATVSRGSGTVTVTVAGYTTTREVTQAVFRFRASPGQSLQQTEIALSTDSLFNAWFSDTASARAGGQFVFQQTFTIQGDPNLVLPESVTLSNRAGSTTSPIQ